MAARKTRFACLPINPHVQSSCPGPVVALCRWNRFFTAFSLRAKPVLLAFIAIGLFALMNAVIKGMTWYYDTLQVAFLRYLFGGFAILIWLFFTRPGWPSIAMVEANVVRGILGLTTGLSFFYALANLPLADAIALSFLAPLFMTMFSMVLLKEKPNIAALAALALGFIGMLIMISGKSDGGERSWFGIGASLTSAIAYGLSITMLRSRAQKDPHGIIVFFSNWIPAMLIAPLNGIVWEPVEVEHLLPFAALGIMGVAAHLCTAKAYSLAATARLAPIEYSALIYAAMIGFFYFGEIPTWNTMIGAILIVVGALIAVRR